MNKSAKFDEDYKAARKSQKEEYALANSKTGANSDEDEKEAILNGEQAAAATTPAAPSLWAQPYDDQGTGVRAPDAQNQDQLIDDQEA